MVRLGALRVDNVLDYERDIKGKGLIRLLSGRSRYGCEQEAMMVAEGYFNGWSFLFRLWMHRTRTHQLRQSGGLSLITGSTVMTQ